MSSPNSNSSGVGLVVRGLRKSFGKQEVLKGVDFEVKPGEIFVIMGPSGSGKSVLLKHLIGLEKPDAGEILINGEPITTPEILRTSLALGMDAVVVGKGSCDPYNPKVVRSSVGALMRLPIETGEDLGAKMEFLRLKGFSIVATSLTTSG